MSEPEYALGHSERELERLSEQEKLIGPATQRFFREAGIEPGMRVLDVGSGAGDCALQVAALVGDGGEVIGTDRVPAAVAAASRRIGQRGLRNVSFRAGDPTELAFERPFDAVVGRYVLWCQADPARMLRGLTKLLRPGGVIAFHEPCWEAARAVPSAPLYERACHCVRETFRRLETAADMSGRLYPAFSRASLRSPKLRLQTHLSGSSESREWLQAVAELVESLLPAAERLGVATAAEMRIGTLAERMHREVTALDCVVFGRSEVAAWARV